MRNIFFMLVLGISVAGCPRSDNASDVATPGDTIEVAENLDDVFPRDGDSEDSRTDDSKYLDVRELLLDDSADLQGDLADHPEQAEGVAQDLVRPDADGDPSDIGAEEIIDDAFADAQDTSVEALDVAETCLSDESSGESCGALDFEIVLFVPAVAASSIEEPVESFLYEFGSTSGEPVVIRDPGVLLAVFTKSLTALPAPSIDFDDESVVAFLFSDHCGQCLYLRSPLECPCNRLRFEYAIRAVGGECASVEWGLLLVKVRRVGFELDYAVHDEGNLGFSADFACPPADPRDCDDAADCFGGRCECAAGHCI